MIAIVLLSAASAFAAGPGEMRGKMREEILIDKVHANDYSHVGLQKDRYDYHEQSGFRLAFDYLRSQGVKTANHTEGRLDGEKLAGHRLLFINLVSAERPPFLVSEIRAIVAFVRSGGSLFIITDHSNAYFHAYRLAPLLDEFGIEVPTDTACDVAPHTLGSGNGWILIEDFSKHPLTEGLRRIAFQTGGLVDERFAVARTSPQSWADAWQTTAYAESNAMGFFGNFARDEGERSGPLGVVLAKEFDQEFGQECGRGRIVIVGDQNIFSDICIDYADNYRLWINAIAWLLHEPAKRESGNTAGQTGGNAGGHADENTDGNTEDNPVAATFPGLSDPAAYRAFRKPRILLAEDFGIGAFGTDDRYGCYHLMSLMRRDYSLLADDRYEEPYDLVVLPNGHLEMNAAIVDLLVGHLRRGKAVLALHTSTQVTTEPKSVLMRVVRKMGVQTPRFQRIDDIRSVAAIPGAGSIYLFPPEFPLFNNMLPSPSTKPDILQADRAVVYLRQLAAVLEAESKKP